LGAGIVAIDGKTSCHSGGVATRPHFMKQMQVPGRLFECKSREEHLVYKELNSTSNVDSENNKGGFSTE
jgi:hypothetical protein